VDAILEGPPALSHRINPNLGAALTDPTAEWPTDYKRLRKPQHGFVKAAQSAAHAELSQSN